MYMYIHSHVCTCMCGLIISLTLFLISIAVNCGPPPQVENGVVRYSGTRLAHQARYRCVTGFELKGFEIRVCTVNGKWNGSTPTCES